MTHGVSLHILSDAARDAASLNIEVGVGAHKLGNLVAVVGEVEIDVPAQVGSVDGLVADAGLDTGVAHAAYVAVGLVAEVAHGSHAGVVDQVGGLAIVPVDRATQLLVPQAPVETHVGRGGSLPLQCGVVGIGTGHGAVAHDIVERTLHAGVDCIVGIVAVVADAFLLAGLTPAQAQLEVAQCGSVLQEALLVDGPGQSGAGEVAPLLVVEALEPVEARRAVGTEGEGEEVALGIVVLHTSEVGLQVVLGAVALAVVLQGHDVGGASQWGDIAGIVGGSECRVVGVLIDIVGVLLAPEVLPLVAGHDVEVVHVVEVLVVLEILTPGEVLLGAVGPAVAAPVAGLRATGKHVGVLLAAREVATYCGVQAQVFKAVHLVVDIGAAVEVVAVGAVVLKLEDGHRVARGVDVGHHGPGAIAQVAVGRGPLKVVVEVLKAAGHAHGLCRIYAQGVAYGTAVGIVILAPHPLGIQVHHQVVVEQRGVEVGAHGVALEVGSLDDTLLARVAQAHAIGQILAHRAAHLQVVVGRPGGAQDFVLPVGAGSTQQAHSRIVEAGAVVHLLDIVAILVAAHHVDGLALHAHGDTAVVAHLGLLAAASLLGSDDDDAVAAAATVDGGCRSVFQDVEALNVQRVDHRQAVGHALDAVVVHGDTVDHNQRVVAGVERRAAANAYRRLAARSTALAGHAHTGHLAGKQVLGIDHDTPVFGVGLDSRYRTRKVALLGDTVTDDHHLVERLCVLVEGDHQVGGSRDRKGLIAHRGNLELGSLGHVTKCEVTVEIGSYTLSSVANDAHTGADHRLALSILNITIHSNLCIGSDGKKQSHQEGKNPQWDSNVYLLLHYFY